MSPRIYSRKEHSIETSMLDGDALKVIRRLASKGYKARLVGGGVRDLLLNKSPKDFDIATDAKPNEIRRVFNNSRIIGKRFKLAHIYFGRGKVIEVATFRAPESDEDEVLSLQTDNNFGTEETDAMRRDLTINGLFYDAENESIIDYVNGMDDLKQGIIRIIGEVDRRFVEDPVRMLRVVRHAVRAGFQIDADTWESLVNQNHLLEICAPMRLYEELKKDLASTCALPILRLLYEGGLLPWLLPAVEAHHLEPRHSFSRMVQNLDLYHEVNPEAPFSIFLSGTILSLFPETVHQECDFQSAHDVVTEHFAFGAAVPRRIKENTAAIINLWSKIVCHLQRGETSATIDSLSLSRKEARHASLVLQLHRILPAQPLDREIYASLLAIKRLERR